MELTETDGRTAHLTSLPDRRAATDPEGACIDDDRLALTNAEFATRVRAAAVAFSDHGVGSGDVVAALLANRVELVVAMLAAWRVGAALTPVNPALTTGEAAFQIQDSGARVVVHEGAISSVPGVAAIDAGALPVTPARLDGSAVGGSTTITGRFSPSTFFDTVETVRPTFFSAVPAIYAMLSALPDDVRPDTSPVRFAVCGAAPMPAAAPTAKQSAPAPSRPLPATSVPPSPRSSTSPRSPCCAPISAPPGPGSTKLSASWRSARPATKD